MGVFAFLVLLGLYIVFAGVFHRLPPKSWTARVTPELEERHLSGRTPREHPEVELGHRVIRVSAKAQKAAWHAQELDRAARERFDFLSNHGMAYFREEAAGEWEDVLGDLHSRGLLSDSDRQLYSATANVTPLTTGNAAAKVSAIGRQLLRKHDADPKG